MKIPRRQMSSTFLFYPDLSTSETDFIQSHVDLVLNPECLEKSPTDIFPPQSRKFLVPRVEYVQKFYRDFKIPKNKNDKYLRNMNSMPKLERTLRALKWARVDKNELDSNREDSKPELILLNPCEILNLHHIAELNTDMSISQVINDQVNTTGAVHGLFAKKHIQKTVMSLKILGFPSASEKIGKLNFAKHRELRFDKMENMMSRVVLEEMGHEIPGLGKYFFYSCQSNLQSYQNSLSFQNPNYSNEDKF